MPLPPLTGAAGELGAGSWQLSRRRQRPAPASPLKLHHLARPSVPLALPPLERVLSPGADSKQPHGQRDAPGAGCLLAHMLPRPIARREHRLRLSCRAEMSMTFECRWSA